VRDFQARWEWELDVFEVFSVGIFSLEYLLRIWACVCDSRFRHPFFGRLRFMLRPLTLIDLISILPFYLPFLGIDLRSLRALRLFRILWIFKTARYYSSLTLIRHVLTSKREELLLTFALMMALLVAASSVMFYCENEAQPQLFSSIPATMWWGVTTLTTVGYGDMCPITAAGKICASVISIIGVGMFALPTGILGAGFIEEMQRKKSAVTVCPHCGKRIDEHPSQPSADR
jgi:voltage-gated potassium channel